MNGSCRTRYIEYEARENKESRGNMEIKRGEKSEEGRGVFALVKKKSPENKTSSSTGSGKSSLARAGQSLLTQVVAAMSLNSDLYTPRYRC